MSQSLRLCTCCEFADSYPFTVAPRDRDVLLHYVKHGPIQPVSGFLRNAELVACFASKNERRMLLA